MNTVENALNQKEADILFDAVWDRCGHHRLQLEWDVARAFIKRIERYNDFDAEKILTALDQIDALMPRKHYGAGNPNNGMRDFRISVGREGSPVIYIERYELFNYCIPSPLDAEKSERIKEIMQTVGKADEADLDVEDYTSQGMGKRMTFRFWWD